MPVDAGMQGCMNAQMSLQCMHANTTARSGGYQQRLPPLPIESGTNGSGNVSNSSSILAAQSADLRRADMHNNPGFEPDFGEVRILNFY